jgi:hypothetical protein
MEKLVNKVATTLEELTNAAVFVADGGSAITGTILNLTAGMIVEKQL